MFGFIKKILRKIYIVIYKIPKELIGEIRAHFSIESNSEFTAIGIKFFGKRHMCEEYRKVNYVNFLKSLRNEVDFLRSYKNKKTIEIVDAGANLGFYTIFYAMTDSNVHVTAFEPFPETFKFLEKNVKQNNISNVQPLENGLFSKTIDMPIGRPNAFNYYSFREKVMSFTDKHRSGCMSVYTTEKNTPTAKFYKGDKCVFIKDKSIDLIKIDVEGAELDTLKGLKNTIDKNHPMIKIEFNALTLQSAGVTIQDIWNYLLKCEYNRFLVVSDDVDFTSWNSCTSTAPDFKPATDVLFI